MSTCIKVNSSGSWANLVPVVGISRLESAKAACEALALASVGDISFRIVTDGEVVEVFHKKPRNGEPFGWHAPRQVRCDNPIQSGLDRNTSGAIGQP